MRIINIVKNCPEHECHQSSEDSCKACDQWALLQEMDGILYEDETLEEAIEKEKFCARLYPRGSRRRLGELMASVNNQEMGEMAVVEDD